MIKNKESLTGKIVSICPICGGFWEDNNNLKCPNSQCGYVATIAHPFKLHFVSATFYENTRGVFYDAANDQLIELKLGNIK